MTRPDALPHWATDPDLNETDVLLPPEEVRLRGHRSGVPPVREHENWRAGLVSDWAEHLQNAPTLYTSGLELLEDRPIGEVGLVVAPDAPAWVTATPWGHNHGDDAIVQQVICDGARVIALTTLGVFCHDAADGAVLWQIGAPGNAIATDGEHFFWSPTGTDGVLSRRKMSDGSYNNVTVTLPGDPAANIQALTCDGEHVYVAATSGQIFCYTRDLENLVWTWSTSAATTWRALAIRGNSLAAALDFSAVGAQRNLFVLNKINPNVSAQSYDVGGGGDGLAVAFGDNHLFVGTDAGLFMTDHVGRRAPLEVTLDGASLPAQGIAITDKHMAVVTPNDPNGVSYAGLVPRGPGAWLPSHEQINAYGVGERLRSVCSDGLNLYVGGTEVGAQGAFDLWAVRLPGGPRVGHVVGRSDEGAVILR